MRIFGVILAGGEGRRMGAVDKALLPLAGRPLVAHVLDRLAPQVERVLISANGDATRFRGFGCQVVPDATGQGPLSGILAAMGAAADQGASHVVSTPVDTPFLPDDLVTRLVTAAAQADKVPVLAADETRDHPATALWPVSLAPALATFLAAGERKVTGFTEAQNAVRAVFPDRQAFVNLNTPEDLAAAEALLNGAA